MDNKYSLYRRIRQERTYRPLGKMSWWRVALGLALLLLVAFITGLVSRPFLARGNFRAAEKLLLIPAWMETYRPEDKAYMDAGVLYQDGEYAAALEGFSQLDSAPALRMRSLAALRLAGEQALAGQREAAAASLGAVDETQLNESEAEEYRALSRELGGR